MSTTTESKADRLLTTGAVRLEQFCEGNARAVVHGDSGDHVVTRTGSRYDCTCPAWSTVPNDTART